jgi:hypothetical protein
MKVELVLGCWGREQDNFYSCSGASNVILDITKNTERNILIAEFLDKVYNIFEKPLYSNVHTALWKIQDQFSEVGRPVFNDKLFKHIEEFCITHKKCGVYLKLIFDKEIGEKMRDTIVVLDIDGTVCDSIDRVKEMCRKAGCEYTWQNLDQLWSKEHLREFFNAEEIAKDKVIQESLKVFSLINKLNAKYLFLTGRNENFKDNTLDWLVNNLGVSRDITLIMRSPEFETIDMQDYKERVFLEQVYEKDKSALYLFFDDDARVIERYAKYGLAFRAPDCWSNFSC